MQVDRKFKINYIDASGISTFNRCPFKYMLNRLWGLKGRDKPTIALDYGTSMHSALPLAYEDADLAIRRFVEVWASFGHGEDDDKRNTQRAMASLYEFYALHSKELCPYTLEEFPITAQVADHVDVGELPFVIDIGASLLAAGRIDYPVRLKSSNKLWALDFKTSSEVSARYFNSFSRCPQACMYSIALSQISGEPVQGLIVEVLRSSKTNTESAMHNVFVSDANAEMFIELAKRTADDILECNDKQEWSAKCTGCSPYQMFGQPGYLCEYGTLCDLPDYTDGVKFYEDGKVFHPFGGLE